MRLYTSFIVVVFFVQLLPFSIAQVVWTEPPFPTQFDDVTVYFDATEGNGALAGFTGDVYAHTGVITSQSAAPNDWKNVQGTWGTTDPKVLMNSEGNDVYSLNYNIEDYYGLETGTIVEELAFVFRDVNGSIVGRDTDGSDIFLTIYPPNEGLLVNLIAPQGNSTILFDNDSLLVNLQVNIPAKIDIFDNENLVFSDSADVISTYFFPETLGEHFLKISISAEGTTQNIERNFFVLEDNETLLNPPLGIKNGLNYTDSTFIFNLVAPQKEHVFLLCPANQYRVDIDYQLHKSEDGTRFWLELPKTLFDNNQTTYQYLVDGLLKIADPYAEVILDPWNDDDVPADVLAELPLYPIDMTTGIVTAFDYEKTIYNWTVENFEKPQQSDLVIYEILMRDFLEDKNYSSLLDTLDYLERLGVNAIELMPIQEFEGNQSWGYNPSFHKAVDKYYGSRNQLRAVIDAAHQKGMAVILDVVFNHAFSQSPLCQLYWDNANFRPTFNNPWLNVFPKHPFNVGYDFNHESTYTKEWVKQVLEYWITEFKFDGFRFDLSKGLTQTNSGENADLMSAYDQSRVDILSDYADYIWSLDPTSYVILEHFAANNEEKVLSDAGMMLWGNMTHEYAEAAMGYSSSLRWTDYTERGWDNPNLIAYMESHDEERISYKTKTWGNSEGNYDTRELKIGVDRVAAASAIFMSIPGPKMLWQLGELGYDFSINRCVDGSINSNCRLDPKPIRWDYLADEYRQGLFERIAAINHLKTSYPTFSTSNFEYEDVDNYLKRVQLSHPDMDAISIANFNLTSAEINPQFTSTGTWYEYFTGVELDVENVNTLLELAAGEYRIYTTEKLTPPNGYFPAPEVEEPSTLPSMTLVPNPILQGEVATIILSDGIDANSLQMYDMLGIEQAIEFEIMEKTIQFTVPQLAAGVYWLAMEGIGGEFTQKIIVLANQ